MTSMTVRFVSFIAMNIKYFMLCNVRGWRRNGAGTRNKSNFFADIQSATLNSIFMGIFMGIFFVRMIDLHCFSTLTLQFLFFIFIP